MYAALNPQTGDVIGQTSPRHTSQEFVGFLEEVVATQPAEREVHVILDNFSAHKTDLVKCFLQQHANVTLHFTPTYSSWLNQVESWFSKLQRVAFGPLESICIVIEILRGTQILPSQRRSSDHQGARCPPGRHTVFGEWHLSLAHQAHTFARVASAFAHLPWTACLDGIVSLVEYP